MKFIIFIAPTIYCYGNNISSGILKATRKYFKFSGTVLPWHKRHSIITNRMSQDRTRSRFKHRRNGTGHRCWNFLQNDGLKSLQMYLSSSIKSSTIGFTEGIVQERNNLSKQEKV